MEEDGQEEEAVRIVTLTNEQRQDILDGKDTLIALQGGGQVLVTPYFVQESMKEALAAGQPIAILPQIIGTNKMDEVRLS